MSYVNAGDRLTWVGEWQNSIWSNLPGVSSSEQVVHNVSSSLQNTQNLVIESQQLNEPILYGKGIVTLVVRAKQDFNNSDDIRQIISHQFYIENGNLPTASRITQINGESTGAEPAPDKEKTYCEKNQGSFFCGGGPSASTLIWVSVAGVFVLGAFFVFLKA